MSKSFGSSTRQKVEDSWRNVQGDCMLCDMDRKTKWYIQTPRFLIAEKLGGGPFIVVKNHKDFLTDDEFEAADHLVSRLFDDYELRVRMNMVKDHWHAHIVTDESLDLSDE